MRVTAPVLDAGRGGDVVALAALERPIDNPAGMIGEIRSSWQPRARSSPALRCSDR